MAIATHQIGRYAKGELAASSRAGELRAALAVSEGRPASILLG